MPSRARVHRHLVFLAVLAAGCTRGGNALLMGPPVPASRPSPWDGELGVVPGTPLRWAPSAGATSYAVHWGTDPITANQLPAPVGSISDPPPASGKGQQVFWRVDAVNSHGVTEGRVWSFTTASSSGLADATALPPDHRFEETLWGVASSSSWRFEQELFVDPDDAGASDSNPGTAAAPLKTIARAMALANPAAGGTRVVLRPGIYREGISVDASKSGTASAPLLIEAVPLGKAVLLGTDRLTGWTPDTGQVYTKPWTLTWGVTALPVGWPSITELGRRREMVFVDGELLRQVLTRAEMTAGTYAVDEIAQKIYVWFDSDPAQHDVEVSVRTNGVYLGDEFVRTNWPSYVAVRGLVVRGFEDSSLVGNHVLAEDCLFEWNDGLVAVGGNDLVVRRNRMLHQGKLGIVMWSQDARHVHALLQDNETSWCNWRWGGMGGLLGYSVAGTKVHSADHLVVRGHVSRQNQSRGLWVDGGRNVWVEGCDIEDNQLGGLRLDLLPGAVVVRGNTIVRNQVGIQVNAGSHVSLIGNLVHGNPDGQIELSCGAPELGTNRLSYLHLLENVVSAGAAAPYVRMIDDDYMAAGETAAVLRSNSYAGSLLPAPFRSGSEDLESLAWITRVHDADADLTPFAFRGPDADDFVPTAGSRIRAKPSWSWVDVQVGTRVTMTASPRAPIRYTLDGTFPTSASHAYQGPISRPSGTLRARAVGYELWGPTVTLPRLAR